MIISLLLGRKGSRGYPGKNTTNVLGKPLAWYPMKTSAAVDDINLTYLSTDDPKLISIASSLDIEIIKRPDFLANDQALGEDVLSCISSNKKKLSVTPEFFVLLFCNAATISINSRKKE